MARYTKPAAAPREIGSIGGVTFQRAGSQFILRIRNAPVDKRSIAQLNQRQRFAALSSQWRDRSNPEKNSFQAEVTNYPREDSLGNPYFQPANALFLGSNLNLTTTEAAAVTTMPAPAAPFVPQMQSGVIGISQNNFQFVLTVVNVPADTIVQCAYSQFEQGLTADDDRKTYKPLYVFQALESTTTSLYSFFSAAVRDPSQFIGQYLTVRYTAISELTGQILGVAYRTAIVQA